MIWSLLVAPALASSVYAYSLYGYWDAGDEAVEEDAEYFNYNAGSTASPSVWGGPTTGWDLYFDSLAPYASTGVFFVSDHWDGYSQRCGVEDFGTDGTSLWIEPSCLTGEAGLASVLFLSYDSWAASGRDLAYALASDASASAPYTPSTAFNSSGGGTTIVHRGTGRYTVRFHGITDPGGVPLVTPYTAGNTDLCRVGAWRVVSGGLNVEVNCLTALVAADMPFSVAYTAGGTLLGAESAGDTHDGFYAYVDMSSGAGPEVPAISRSPDAAGDVEVLRYGPGAYVVSVSGLPNTTEADTYALQITNGRGAAVCEATEFPFAYGGGTISVGVYCQNTRGWYIDSPFVVVASVGG